GRNALHPTSLRARQPTGPYLQRNISRGGKSNLSCRIPFSGVGVAVGFLYPSKLEFCARFFIILIPAMSSFQHCQGVSNALGNLEWPSWTRDPKGRALAWPAREPTRRKHKRTQELFCASSRPRRVIFGRDGARVAGTVVRETGHFLPLPSYASLLADA